MANAPSLFGPGDLLREARHRLPEMADQLALCAAVPASVLADAVAYETYAWARDADEADRDIVFRIFDVWASVLEQDDVDPEVRHVLIAVLGLLRVLDHPVGRDAAGRASPEMRRWMEEAPRVVSPLNGSLDPTDLSPRGHSANDLSPVL